MRFTITCKPIGESGWVAVYFNCFICNKEVGFEFNPRVIADGSGYAVYCDCCNTDLFVITKK